MTAAITGFNGEYRWLSNFWPAPVEMYGVEYPTVEHAYAASKCANVSDRALVLACVTPQQAKKKGKSLPMRPDHPQLKLQFMTTLIHRKFLDSSLAELLVNTSPRELVEDNWWNDTFFGVCNGVGENHLGRILMAERENLIHTWG